jgi:hypothetical protein
MQGRPSWFWSHFPTVTVTFRPVTGFACGFALATEVEPSFDRLAADLRKLTRGRRQTPSEVLQRGALKTLVIDASIAIKWVVKADGTDLALA